MWVLNGATVPDTYDQGARGQLSSLANVEGRRYSVLVMNAAVYIRTRPASKVIRDYDVEALFPPGFYNFAHGIRGLQIRNVVAGLPAKVTIRVYGRDD